jgi:hypothetical protein
LACCLDPFKSRVELAGVASIAHGIDLEVIGSPQDDSVSGVRQTIADAARAIVQGNQPAGEAGVIGQEAAHCGSHDEILPGSQGDLGNRVAAVVVLKDPTCQIDGAASRIVEFYPLIDGICSALGGIIQHLADNDMIHGLRIARAGQDGRKCDRNEEQGGQEGNPEACHRPSSVRVKRRRSS